MHMWSVFAVCVFTCMWTGTSVCVHVCACVHRHQESSWTTLHLILQARAHGYGLVQPACMGNPVWNYKCATVDSADPNPSPHAHPARALTTHLIPSPYLSILKYFPLLNPPACLRGEIFFNVLLYRCFNNAPLLFCC